MGSRWKSNITVNKQVSDQGLATALKSCNGYASHLLVACKHAFAYTFLSSRKNNRFSLSLWWNGRTFAIRRVSFIVRGKKCDITLDLEMFYIVEFNLFLVSLGLGE